MATLLNVDKVKYRCNCKREKPLCNLYFCKHCVTLKCKECVLHEIDPKYYCPYCFDNKTSKEAIQLRYKCSNCYNCPMCNHTLMTRASTLTGQQKSTGQNQNDATTQSPTPSQAPQQTSTPNPSPQQQQQQQQQVQKVYYLVCAFCRWTTRDANIPDATQTPGGWKLQESPNAKRIEELIDNYKGLCIKEKQEKEKKKYPFGKRKIYQSPVANDMYGILKPFQKFLPSAKLNEKNEQIATNTQHKCIEPSIATCDFEPFDVDYYLKSVDIDTITSINQRISNPEFQPETCKTLYPLNKLFITKESKRCNVCEHNVIKPETNITSIKFKLHQMAILMVPEVRIVTIPQWKINEKNEVILSITNKCESEVNVTLISNNEEQMKNDKSNIDNNSTAIILFDDNTPQTLTIDRQDMKGNYLKQTDNLNYVCYRKDNKIAIKCQVIPLYEDKNVQCTFEMKHSYYGMSVDLQSAPVMQELTQFVTIDFGPFKTSNFINKPKYIDDCINSSKLSFESSSK